LKRVWLPFFLLRTQVDLTSDGFWHLVPYPGKENELRTIIERNIPLITVNQINEATIGAKLDDELFELVKIKESRDLLRSILIENYFAPEAKPVLPEQSQIND